MAMASSILHLTTVLQSRIDQANTDGDAEGDACDDDDDNDGLTDNFPDNCPRNGEFNWTSSAISTTLLPPLTGTTMVVRTIHPKIQMTTTMVSSMSTMLVLEHPIHLPPFVGF